MKYTIKSFIQNLIGDEKELKQLEANDCFPPIYLFWNGDRSILIRDSSHEELDCINFCKTRKNFFSMELQVQNYWYFTLEFSDGGLVKNRKYYLRDYIGPAVK